MKQEFEDFDDRLRFFIGDVRDEQRLHRAMSNVDYIIHAAALKQVPSCEYNPIEAVNTNIIGATNVINAALDTPTVKRVIALSTDKAVNPINLYGGTKLVSDKLFTAANSYSGYNGCRFSVVRYGNVAGSRGSIIPVFREKLLGGNEKLPLTDERMTRFWMTLDKAVTLVILALEKSFGGEIFVYKNPSFYVKDLIAAMNDGIGHDLIGIREGEKLHECMITKSDSSMTYEYDDFYIIYPNYEWWNITTKFIQGGTKVPNGWEYTSDNNKQWLSIEELVKLVSCVYD
jgi:UDP-N-acetylglucosamine 4,6-dehydratase (inverting)